MGSTWLYSDVMFYMRSVGYTSWSEIPNLGAKGTSIRANREIKLDIHTYIDMCRYRQTGWSRTIGHFSHNGYLRGGGNAKRCPVSSVISKLVRWTLQKYHYLLSKYKINVKILYFAEWSRTCRRRLEDARISIIFKNMEKVISEVRDYKLSV